MSKRFKVEINILDKVQNRHVWGIDNVTVEAENVPDAISKAYALREDAVRGSFKFKYTADVVLGEVLKVERVYTNAAGRLSA